MKTIYSAATLALFTLLSACGGKLEFDEEPKLDARAMTPDGARADAAAVDAANPDARPDAGADTRIADGAVPDGASPDGSQPDLVVRLDVAPIPDAAIPDAALPDASTTDVSVTDVAGLDAAIDASTPDAPSVDVSLADASDASACRQDPVALGAAGDFAVLAGSTVTSTGATSVLGDLGVSPGTAVTGFPPGTVVGMLHAGTPTSAQGIAALTIAYNDAAGRTLCPVSVAGNLGGQTLAPGLYKSTSSLEITSGDLTLDGKGDPNAVFIFQIASTFTTTDGRQVLLINDAKAANVFWQVGTSATLGSTSILPGTVMADQAITLNTGATVNGRLLARIAGVSLAGNAIVKPLP